MDFTAILIGLGIIIALIIVGKVFAFLSKIFFIIILIIALVVGFFFWQNNNNKNSEKTFNTIQIIKKA